LRKKIILAIGAFILSAGCVFAQSNFLGKITSGQEKAHTKKINTLRNALGACPDKTETIIRAEEAFSSRGRHYRNTLQRERYIKDLKAALFYLIVYDDKVIDEKDYKKALKIVTKHEKKKRVDDSSQSRMDLAQNYYNEKLFEASGYEYYVVSKRDYANSESLEGIADAFSALHYNQKAIETYDKAIAENQYNQFAKAKLADVYERIGDYDTSKKIIDGLIFNLNNDPRLLAKLETAFLQGIKTVPNNSDNYINLGMVYQKQQKYDRAYTMYQKAIKLNADDIFVKYVLSTLYFAQKRYSNALELFNQILNEMPSDSQIRSFKAESLAALGRKNEAIKQYEYILNQYPDVMRPKVALYELVKDKYTPERMMKYLFPRLKNRKVTAQNYYYFANALQNAGKTEDAEKFYQMAIQLNPKYSKAYLELAKKYESESDLNNAFYIISSANRNSPQDKEVRSLFNSLKTKYNEKVLGQADFLIKEGNYREAISVYKRVEPQSFKTTYAIATCYQLLKDNRNAIEFYRKSLEFNPKSADTYYYLGIISYNEGKYGASKDYLKKAIQIEPKFEKAEKLLAHVNLLDNNDSIDRAYALYEKKDYNKAVALLTKLIKENPKNAEAYYYRGIVNDTMGKYDVALKDYQTASKIDDKIEDIHYFIARAYDKQGKTSLALQEYETFLNSNPQDADYILKAQKRISELGIKQQSSIIMQGIVIS